MKVIDLLNKIANGEIKDKQKFRVIYQYSNLHRDFYYDENEGSFLNSLKNISDDYVIYDEVSLNDEIEIIEELNNKIEIIEELNNKIEKMECDVEAWFMPSQADIEIIKKLNELIDYINNKENNE